MKKLMLLILTLVCVNESFADRRRDEQKENEEIAKLQAELKMVQDQYDRLRVNRWQDKRNAVAKKEAFQEVWEGLRRDVEKLQSQKSQKDEALVRLEQQVTEAQKNLDEQKSRMKDFGVTVAGKAGELEKFLVSSWPNQSEEMRKVASSLASELEKTNFEVDASVIDQYFLVQNRLFDVSEARSLNRVQFPVRGTGRSEDGKNPNPASKTAALVAGHLLEIGGISKVFWSTETPDVAMLVKTGRIDAQSWDYIEALLPEKKLAMQKVLSQINSSDTGKALLIPLDVQMRKGIGEGFTSYNEHSWYAAILEEWKHAGFVVWGFGAITLLALIIMGDKLFTFLRRGGANKKWIHELCIKAESGDIKGALLMTKKQNNAVSLVLKSILKSVPEGREAAESHAYERILHETPRLERGVFTLSILAAAAPLVGLLGTVSGMVTLFASITLHGTGDPRIMSEGISEALLSTKWALMIAIPCLFAYNWAHNKSNKIIADMEKYAARLLNAIWIPHPSEDHTPTDLKVVENPSENKETPTQVVAQL